MPLAVITGSTGPIGRAIAQSFSERGYDLILPAHTQFDLAQVEGQNQFCSYIKSCASEIDVLIHCAASFEQSSLRSLTREIWDSTMSLNAGAPLFITKDLLPLLESARAPCVVNLLDSKCEKPWRNYLAYTSSKSLLAQLTASLALELAPHIRVNAVAPGIVDFPSDWQSEKKQRVTEKIPMARAATPEEIAKAVIYLACDASYTTGEILRVDGGRHFV